MENKTKIFFPFNHGFMLHSEYLHHEEYFEDDTDEDLEVEDYDDEEDDEYKSWNSQLKQEEEEDQREEEEEKYIDKLDSPRYPVFMSFDALKTKTEIIYPTIIWKHTTQEFFENQRFDFRYGEVYTANGLLMIMAISENDIIYRPLRIDVKFTDYPYIEVRKISKFLNTYLFHFNPLQYLDVEDDGEVEKDLFQSSH